MHTTMGFPIEAYIKQIESMKTLKEQAEFTANFRKRNKNYAKTHRI